MIIFINSEKRWGLVNFLSVSVGSSFKIHPSPFHLQRVPLLSCTVSSFMGKEASDIIPPGCVGSFIPGRKWDDSTHVHRNKGTKDPRKLLATIIISISCIGPTRKFLYFSK